MQNLLLLLVFTLPLGVLLRIKLYEDVYLNLPDLIVAGIFIMFIYGVLKKKIKITFTRVLYPLIGFIFVGFTSLLINLQYLTPLSFLNSFLYLARFACYTSLIFAVIAQDSKSRNRIVNALLISGLIFTIFGFIQYFLYDNLRNLYYAGWDDHLYRLFSTALDPNFAGIFIVLGLLLALSRLINIKNSRNVNIALAVVSVLELIAIYLTYSRSAFIGLVIGLLSLLFFSGRKKILIPAIIVIILGLVVFSNTKIEGLNPFRTASSFARVATTKQAVNIFLDNPVIGVGFDSLRYAQIRYGFRSADLPIPSNADAGTDNSYLFILVTTGIIGFAFFAKFVLEIISTLFKHIENNNTKVSLSTLFAVLSASLFINALFYPLIMSWLFIIIGISLAGISKKK